MRSKAPAGPAAFVALVLALAAPVPAAAGGAAGPSTTGGARYDRSAPRPAARPVASGLAASPRTLVAGDAPPRLRFSVRQRGIAQVQARIVVLRLPRGAAVARVSLGWVKTDRRVDARWPTRVALRPGRYLVRLHVKDSRGHTLRRDARNPGRTLIVVRGRRTPPAPVAPRPPPPAAALPAPAPSAAVRGVFPVAGPYDLGGADGRFGAARNGHAHEGQDILAAAGTIVVAPVPGTVSNTSYQARGAGEYIVLDGADGRDYFFAHCLRGTTTVAQGTLVAAGQPLCRVGSSGTVSGAHLHFEIWVVGWRIAGGFAVDPLPELRSWAKS